MVLIFEKFFLISINTILYIATMLVELRFPMMLSLFLTVLPVIKQEPSYRQFLFYSQYSISSLLLISIHLLTEFQFFLQSVHHLIFREDF